MNMLTTLDKYVPVLDRGNYQDWKRKMQAYLQSIDLWLVVNGTWTCPVPAIPTAPTNDETESINRWDALDKRA